MFFGVAAKEFALTEGLLPEDESFDRWFKFVTRETGLIVGVLLVLVGVGVAASVASWAHTGYGPLPPMATMRRTLPAMMCLMFGTEVCFGSFFLSLLGRGGGKAGRSFADKPLVTILANRCASFGPEFTGMYPEDAARIFDGGRTFNGGNPPNEISFNGAHVPNPRKKAPPQTILGATQKAWFQDQLRKSTATWKIWGNSEGAPDWRSDPQNLPPGLTKETWPKTTYALMSSGDYGSAYRERAEIYDLVRDEKITGFAIVSGDRHSFWAGYATSELPPGKFDPVGLSFVGASLSSAGTMEALEHTFPKADPLRPLFLADRPGGSKPDWTYNMLLKHGVRSCLEYAKSFDLKRAHAVSNAELAPHLEFVDLGGHGYATVRLSADEMRTEFVCIPRPITRSERADGGPLRYRVVHNAPLWRAGEKPKLVQQVLEGDVGLST